MTPSSLMDVLGRVLSPLVVPSVYFDTQILSLVARGKILAQDWECVGEYIDRNAQHCISLTTMYELLAGAATGDESRFDEYRSAFAALRINRHQTYLPLVGDFVRNRLFNLPIRRGDFAPDELSKWIEVVLRSASRVDLLNGLVELGTDGEETYGFKLKMVQCHILKGKAQYIRRLKALKRRETYEPGAWASQMVSQLQLPLTAENEDIIERSLDAAHRHDVNIRRKSTQKNFNFKKHATSWLDSNQLFYLADPNFIFVTFDTKLIGEISDSPQAKRVISFHMLLTMAQRWHSS